jgi:hypothetical protein
MEKFVNVHFASKRKEARVSEVRKVIERDIGITGGDSKLRQINPHVNLLVCLLVFLLSELLE